MTRVKFSPQLDSAIFVTKLDGSEPAKIETGLRAVGDPAMTVVGDRTFLAFTALPVADATFRQLQVIDVTGKY